MPDLNKLYEKADKYLQRQKYEAALETFQEILRYEPYDEEALTTLGDLSMKLNRSAEALRYQVQLADLYIKRGDNAKAIAACRKILKLSPQDVVTIMKLAGLLDKGQKNGEALEAYREALQYYRRINLPKPILECLTRTTTLDPANLGEHLELAEVAIQLHQPKLASAALNRAIELARRAGDEAQWETLVEKAHALDPNDEAAALAAVELHLKRKNFAEAATLVQPIVAKRPDDLPAADLACRSYLGCGKYLEAQPLCWKVYHSDPARVDLILALTEGLIKSGAVQQVLASLDELKTRLFQRGQRNEFLRIVEKVYETDESNLEVLELLSNLYNEMNREDGLRRSLSRLFNSFLAGENYRKAADTLERILDVDPYGEGHYDRLLTLEGHIDAVWYNNILTRLEPPSSAKASQTTSALSTQGEKAESLEDLLVEGEMYHQYQLSSKLEQTLEKIDRSFPGADEKNQRVRDLYESVGYTPKFRASAAAASDPSSAAASFQSLDDLRKISEITANIYRESTPQGVLQVAVSEIGRAINASRCWCAIGTLDHPPLLTAEYCSPLAVASDPSAALKLFAFFMSQPGVSPEGWSWENAAQAPLLAPVSAEVEGLGIRSLQALPLMDKDAPAGLLILEQCNAPRAWSAGETVLFKASATQVAIAINNTKLRRVVRSLAGTDPETGLLPRSSYIDCLLAEARRSKDQAQPLSVCLLEPENPHGLMKSLGDAGVQRYVQQISKSLIPSLRQNDICIRYSPLSLVVVFPDTALPQAGLVVEKARHMLAQVRVNGVVGSTFHAAVCDVPLGPSFDAVDGVTEVINRLETSLDRAHKELGKGMLISKFAG